MEIALYILAGIGGLALCGLGYIIWAFITNDWSN